MLIIDNLERWTDKYFSEKENQKKAEKAWTFSQFDAIIL